MSPELDDNHTAQHPWKQIGTAIALLNAKKNFLLNLFEQCNQLNQGFGLLGPFRYCSQVPTKYSIIELV